MTPSRRLSLAPAFAWVLAVFVCGCGIQVAGAYRADPQGGRGRCGALLGGQMAPPRGPGPVVGGSLALSDPAREPGVRLRSVKLAAGYRFPVYPWAFELAAESGLGAPMFARFDGTGVYIGGTAALLYRLYGEQDDQAGLAPGALLVDAVVNGYGGAWAQPFGTRGAGELPDVGLSLGLRFSGISDLFTANHEGWER